MDRLSYFPIEIILFRLIPLVSGIEVNKYVSTVMGISCLGWFTYYYLGYLFGNEIIEINTPTKTLLLIWGVYSPSNIRRKLVFINGREKLRNATEADGNFVRRVICYNCVSIYYYNR